MSKKIDRSREERVNSFGSRMIIKEYRKYKVLENGKLTYEYKIYYSMIQRCYDLKYQKKEPTYKNCTVEDYLLNFQHMGEWINENYYEVPGENAFR